MKIITEHEWLKQEVFDLVHLFIQNTSLDENKPFVYLNMQQNGRNLFVQFEIEFDNETVKNEEFFKLDNFQDELQEKRFIKRTVKSFLYKILANYLNVNLPWGSLTGIRPTRVAYELLGEGIDKLFLEDVLKEKFYVSDSKAKLTSQVIKNQTCIIRNDKLVDIYVNIPFCPTKCAYCSFISAEYSKVEAIIPKYIEALIKEIRAVKKLIVEDLYIVRSIYIGGGTPSVLSPIQLEQILSELTFGEIEFTVECGRPDTITKEKLDVLKKYGVTRISINPQTFVDSTLKRIGRSHTSEHIIEAYKLALNYNFSINMDLIAGLPGETLRGFKKSVNTAIEMCPDNITIHTLALKKGSQMAEQNSKQSQNSLIEKMVDYGQTALFDAGYKPYYMYKLKNQCAGLENVGFYMDKVCMFNIDSMEETASILACGANAITKRVYSLENRIERQANVKFATDYINRIDELISKKQQLFKN